MKQVASGGRAWAAAFGASLLLFGLTLAPDVLMMDSGEYQCAAYRFPHLELGDRPLDLVRVHPTYIAVAKLAGLLPVGGFAARVNAVSAIFGAIAVANACLLALWLTRSRAAALLAGLVLALGHTVWAFAVIAEVMTMLAACVTTELLCWYRFTETRRPGWLVLLAAVNGVGIATHLQLGLSTPVYAAAILMAWRRGEIGARTIVACAAAGIVCSLPYSALVAYYGIQSGDWAAIFHSATRGRFGPRPLLVGPRVILRGLESIALNYPTLLILPAVPGTRRLWTGRHPRGAAGVILGVAAVQFIFAITYNVPDQYSFFVPFYAVAAVLIAVGAAALLQRRAWRIVLPALAMLPPAVYAAAAPVMRARQVRFVKRVVPYRDPYDFFIKPWKCGDRGQREYMERAFSKLPPNAIVVCSYTMRFMLEYGQLVEGRRPDVQLVDGAAELLENINDSRRRSVWKRPVFATDAEASDFPAAIRQACSIRKSGLLFEIGPPTSSDLLRSYLTPRAGDGTGRS